MNNFYVYLHKKKSSGEVFYVGKGRGNRSVDFSRRSKFWASVASSHGVDVEIHSQNLLEDEAFRVEAALIKQYGRRQFGGTLVNLTDGGEGVSGMKMSDEARRNLSNRLMGDKNVSKRPEIRLAQSERIRGDANPMRNNKNSQKVAQKNTGKKASEETKRKMSEAHTGKKFSDETRKKISESKTGSNHPLFGKTLSYEYRAKISKSSMGRIVSDETRAKISVSRIGKKYPRSKL